MPESENSDGIISEKELIELVDLFAQFEGAPDPFSKACKEAKNEFRARISAIYFDRIEPNPSFKEFKTSQFHSVIRNKCRDRLAAGGSKYLCP